jgi:hypothetical protein
MLSSDKAIVRNIAARRLIYGPYVAPEVKIGDELLCSVYGLQVVSGWCGPKQWPRAKARGRPRLIICGDLRRALELETCETVCLHWGIHLSTVAKWRKKLGLELNMTVAGSAFRVAKMRTERLKNPERYVFPGQHAISTLSLEARNAIGRLTAGTRAWSVDEIEALRHLTNKAAELKLHRSLGSIRNARARYGIPHP